MDDNQLDRAIDRVAREMTAGEPENAAGFRARVMARLDEPKPIWRSPWVLSPIAVAAIVLIVVLVQRDGGKVTPTPSETVAPQQTSAARQAPSRSAEAERSLEEAASRSAEGERSTGDAARSAKASRSRATAASRSSSSSLEREALAERPSEVAALAPPPLAVESIAVTEIAPAATIQVPQMEIIEPITVAPIGEPQGERP